MEELSAEPLFTFDLGEEHGSNHTPEYQMKIVAEEIAPPPGIVQCDTTPNSTPTATPPSSLGALGVLDPDTEQRILDQVEFYFSDANVTKDKELAKQIRRNDMGYVSIKWITSFRKIQALTHDWKAVSKVLTQSTQLKVSNDKKMVRRKHPIPKKSDDFADKTVMACNLTLPERTVECVKDLFKDYGTVTLVRFLAPGKPYPEEIQKLGLPNWRGCPAQETIAVEFDSVDAAERTVLKLSNNWRSTSQVQILRSKKKIRKNSEQCVPLAHSLQNSCNINVARSLPANNRNGSSLRSAPRSVNANSYGESYSPSASSYLGQRLAARGSPSSTPMGLIREPKGPDGTRGFGHRTKVQA